MKTFTISSNTILLWSLAALFSCDNPSGKQGTVQQGSQQDSAAVAVDADCAPVGFKPGAGRSFTNTDSAKELTKKHRKENPNSENDCKKGYAYYFNKNLIDSLIKQKGAVGIRVYNTRDTGNRDGVILVAVGENGKDLLGQIPNKGNSTATFASYIMGKTDMKCPQNCDLTSPLYTD